MKRFLIAVTALFLVTFSAEGQSIENNWEFESITTTEGVSLFDINPLTDKLSLEDGRFEYDLAAKDNLHAEGDYMFQNNLLVFYYSQPTDTIRTYRISELTDSTLVFNEKGVSYRFKMPKAIESQLLGTVNSIGGGDIVASQGFSLNSLIRGAIGMLVLLLLSFLLSKDRKAINWRTVGFGLAAQLILAVGVLKVPFVQAVFEWIGGIFVDILDFTMAGTKFLFAAFSTGEIGDSLLTFAISILPTIIFFSVCPRKMFPATLNLSAPGMCN